MRLHAGCVVGAARSERRLQLDVGRREAHHRHARAHREQQDQRGRRVETAFELPAQTSSIPDPENSIYRRIQASMAVEVIVAARRQSPPLQSDDTGSPFPDGSDAGERHTFEFRGRTGARR